MSEEAAESVESESEAPAEATESTETHNGKPSLLNGETDEVTALDFSEGKPDDFPDDFWNAEENTVNASAMYDRLKKSEKRVEDLRAKMGKGTHKAPKTAEEYSFEPSEEFAAFVKDDDPLISAAKERAHKIGMSQEMFGEFMSGMGDALAEIASGNQGMTEEQQAEYVKAEVEKLGAGGEQIVRTINTWANGLKEDGHITDTEYDAMLDMGDTAEKISLLNKLRAMSRGPEIPFSDIDDGLPADPEIARMIAKAEESGDPAMQAKVDKILTARQKAGRPLYLQT